MVFTERSECIRIISARKATRHEQGHYFREMARDGALTVTRGKGRGHKVIPVAPGPMNESEIEAAARADADNLPLKVLKQLRRVPQIKTLRRALALTQEEFAARYQIPLGTLRDWEQGRCEPDQPARTYLKVIARDPEGVRKTLQRAR